MLYGSQIGLTTISSQVWHQDKPNVAGSAEAGDHFGSALAMGDFDGDGYGDLAIGVPDDDVHGVADVGGVNVLHGSADGLTAIALQAFLTLPGDMGDHAGDRLGAALVALDVFDTGSFASDGPAGGHPDGADLAIGIPGLGVQGGVWLVGTVRRPVRQDGPQRLPGVRGLRPVGRGRLGRPRSWPAGPRIGPPAERARAAYACPMIQRAATPPDEVISVLFDRDCGFCQWTVRQLRGMDRHDRMRFIALQNASSGAAGADLADVARAYPLDRAIHVVSADGTVHAGGRAMLRILDALPGGRLLRPWVTLPGAADLVDLVYMVVARNRNGLGRLVAGSDEAPACVIDPPLRGAAA